MSRRLSRTARLELAEVPWLTPFIGEDDTDLAAARQRYMSAEVAAKAEIRARGITLHERLRTSTGLETTALKTHPGDEATT